MKIISEIENFLEKTLTPKRYKHTLSVRDTAVELATVHGVDLRKVEISALLHDCAKCMSGDELLELAEKYGIEPNEIESTYPYLLHAKVGAAIAKDRFSIDDEEILDGIRSHTTGNAEMSRVAKIVYIADFCEPGRARVREVAMGIFVLENLDEATFEVIRHKILRQIEKSVSIHPDTIDAYNSMSRPDNFINAM